VDKSYTTSLTAFGPGPVDVERAPSGGGSTSTPRQGIIWDNGGSVGVGYAISSQNDAGYPFVSQVADDFQFTEDMDVMDVHWWGDFWNGPPDEVDPSPFWVYFYADDGSGNMPTGAGMADPAPTALAGYYFPGVTGYPLDPFGMHEYNVVLDPPFTAIAGQKYWIAIQADFLYPPQWGWIFTDGVQLHQAMQGFPLLGTPFWTDPVPPGVDMAFYLTGEAAGGGCPFSVSPEAGTVDPESFDYLTLTFDGTAFAECVDETLTCYLSITSNDPDEPQVTVEVSMWPGRGDVFDPFCLIELGDLVFLINYVLKGGPAPDPLCMGDCDPTHDGVVDLADVVYLVQFLYQGGMPPMATPEIHQPGTIKQLSPQAPEPTPRKLK
jgi:hypothetical protein